MERKIGTEIKLSNIQTLHLFSSKVNTVIIKFKSMC